MYLVMERVVEHHSKYKYIRIIRNDEILWLMVMMMMNFLIEVQVEKRV